MNRLEKRRLCRLLKGAAGHIIIALFLHGGAMMNRDLEEWTGYSDKPIARGLALLESEQLVQNNGLAGWSLTATAPEQLNFLGLLDTPSRKYSDSSRNISDSPPPLTTTTTKDPLYEDQVVVVSSKSTASRKISDPNVRHWLLLAGIGRNSPALKRILRLQPEIDYVAAHVLEFLAVRSGVAEWPRPFSTGLLIRRLLDGDAAPQMRCPDCLVVESPRGCKCYWDDVIMR